MMSYCEFVTFPLVSWVRCGTWLYRFLIFALFLTLKPDKAPGPTKSNHCCYKKNSALKLPPFFNSFFPSPWRMGPYHLNGTKQMFHPFTKRETNPVLRLTGPYPSHVYFVKIFEHIVASNVVKHLDSNRTLYYLQHGFRSKRSYETQLTMLIEETHRNLKEGKKTGPKVIKLEFILKLKIKSYDWLLADKCPQAANHCALF